MSYFIDAENSALQVTSISKGQVDFWYIMDMSAF
jgi:hypothetical protein